ncbi:MAG: hypothetical protein ACLUI3_02325 [Christensenellales bacterium]
MEHTGCTRRFLRGRFAHGTVLLLMVLLFFAAMIAAIQISTKRVAQEKTR